jgi:hypothetical protein
MNMTHTNDERLAYGASCTWFGSIHEVSAKPVSARGFNENTVVAELPCCPCCKGMLFEMSNEAEWWTSVKEFEDNGHAGYRAMLEWQRGQKRCFGTFTQLLGAYKAATGMTVNI